MSCSIILTHLGESIPPYSKDCIHQLRLWNPIPIYVILDPCHRASDFWNSLQKTYTVTLVFTDTLVPTDHHRDFTRGFQGDTTFRKGFWKHVKERFFYVEELIKSENLTHIISMEYDVLVYTRLSNVIDTFNTSTKKQCIRIVRDNDDRGHPGFMYIPSLESIQEYNRFLISILHTSLEDMQALALYANTYKDRVAYLPVITEARNRSIPNRRSTCGHTSQDPFYLSEDSDHLGVLFDSAVVGQWVGGIDSRNTGGAKVTKYENESALYKISEMKFQWKKDIETFLWQPFLDGQLLATIHVHSKALASFRSDRADYPKDDYDVKEVIQTLLRN